MTDIPYWKTTLPPFFNKICGVIQVDDVIIEWIDIIFEQIGNATKCPPHLHAWYEFNYVLAGEMRTIFGDQTVCVGTNQFFLIPPGTVHAHTYNPAAPHEGICIRWRIRQAHGDNLPEDGSLFARLDSLANWSPGSYSDRYRIGDMLLQLFREAEAGASVFSLRLMLLRILDALTLVQKPDQAVIATEHEGADRLLRKIEVHLQDLQGNRLDVKSLAASLHMSYGHLSRLFKQSTGMTIVERMNNFRLQRAAVLLQQPGLSIREAAEQAGFPDAYYFSKRFKGYYGCSPREYRKRLNP
ncbi:helix-turn-helix domain-containing protein [Paenibacillus sp. GCM10027626]|uniref:helix-turn-helix transcriptional regulator n=1 Tax=Paenibacillus sp. GCM10027626 TaxID=3273411 RepID=UPI003630CCC5